MQETRRYILEILKEYGESTVDDIVAELQKRRGQITAVTVRHHLNTLQKEELITTPQARHRSAPGRPQHVYMLSEKAREFFPSNYQPLAIRLIEQMADALPQSQINVILEGVADRMAQDADVPDAPLPHRLDKVVEYLNQHGYNASWENHPDGFILQTNNCPYHQIAESNHSLCEMDMRLVASLLGIVPRLLARASAGDSNCAYLIPMMS